MRRFWIGAAVVLAPMTMPASVSAATTVQKVPFDFAVTLCNGHVLELSGILLDSVTTTATPSGGLILAFHDSPQGVTAVDTATGTVFHATGLTRGVDLFSPPGGFVETFVNRFHIQATQGAESYVISETEHVTVTPNGAVAVSFDNFSATC